MKAVKASVVIIMKFILPGCHRPSLLTLPGAPVIPGLSQRSLVTCDSIISILCPGHSSTVILMPIN